MDCLHIASIVKAAGDDPQPEEAPCCPPRKPSVEVQ